MGVANSNGSVKPANGHANGNGKHIAPRPRRASKKRSGFFAWVFSTIARLTTWFAILTIFFRCPSTLEACDDSSPFICQYYFQAKNVVLPQVQPYYDQYAAPYVDTIQPYYATLDTSVLTPARAYAIQYGAPYVEKAQEYGLAQWEKHGQPELVKVQALAQKQYDQTIAPHLAHAGTALGPYYEIAKVRGQELYYEYVLPGYQFMQPYAIEGYDVVSDFTTSRALPAAWWAWDTTYAFIDTAIWPHARVLYLENVEPQLLRIGERLGRYKNKVKSKTGPVGSLTR
jgi:hypothetical protein